MDILGAVTSLGFTAGKLVLGIAVPMGVTTGGVAGVPGGTDPLGIAETVGLRRSNALPLVGGSGIVIDLGFAQTANGTPLASVVFFTMISGEIPFSCDAML